MAQSLGGIDREVPTDTVAVVVTTLARPFAFSIATGIGHGCVTHAALQAATGRAGEVGGAAWPVAVL